MKKLFIIILLLAPPAYSELCDKEKREYLEIRKKLREASKQSGKENTKSYQLLKLPKNQSKLKEWSKISSTKRCTELRELALKAGKAGKAGVHDLTFPTKEMKSEYDKAHQKHKNYCGKKLENILYEVNPAYKQAEKSFETIGQNAIETSENLADCIKVKSL